MLFFHLLKYRLVMLAVMLLVSCRVAVAEEQEDGLKFNDQGMFKIVQFTDIHWKNDSPEGMEKGLKLMAMVLDEEKPDLAVFTGDIVYSTPACEGWKGALKPVVDRKIPWAMVHGNHDDEFGLSREETIAMLQKMPGSLVRPGPKDIGGCGNYVLKIKASATDNNAAAFYFIDSNAYPLREELGEYDWIKCPQINWYREQSAHHGRANGGCPLPSLMFFHIPLPEYRNVKPANDVKSIGSMLEPVVSCSAINSGMFAAILESGDVMGVFVGHDHDNDYAGCLHGVCLAYGRTTGYDAYGKLPRGARVIELIEGRREFNSWIRDESGDVTLLFHYPSTFNNQQKSEKPLDVPVK